jgi:hypothetical protein
MTINILMIFGTMVEMKIVLFRIIFIKQIMISTKELTKVFRTDISGDYYIKFPWMSPKVSLAVMGPSG